MSHGYAPHLSLSDVDAWLIGYPGYMPSPVHTWAEVGEASGAAAPPTLNEWRVMQSTAVSTDLGMAMLAAAVVGEGLAPAATRGMSWYLTRFAMIRYARYARLAFGPVGIAAFFVIEAATNWTRDPSLAATRKASWAAEAAKFN